MTNIDIAEKVINIIARQSGRSPEEIQLNFNLIDDLGADSLDLTEILLVIEKNFKLVFRTILNWQKNGTK